MRAASLSCDSTAHDACGVPNPRNAVLGVVCDSSARARHARVRRPVRPARRVAGLADDAPADVGVGADQEVRLNSWKTMRPSLVERRPGVDPRRRAPHGLKRLLERQHQPHRPAEAEREERQQRLELRPALAAEAAAGIRRDDPDAAPAAIQAPAATTRCST